LEIVQEIGAASLEIPISPPLPPIAIFFPQAAAAAGAKFARSAAPGAKKSEFVHHSPLPSRLTPG